MKNLLPLLAIALTTVSLAAASEDRVQVADESITYNDPEAKIFCPEGQEKRTKAETYQDLDRTGLDAKRFPPPVGYVPTDFVKPPVVKAPRTWTGKPKFGFARVAVTVDAGGDVIDLEVICSTGDEFEKAALKGLATARFRPASLNGVPEPTVAIVPVSFATEQQP